MKGEPKPIIVEADICDPGGYTINREYIVKMVNEKIASLYSDALELANYYSTSTIGPSDDGMLARKFIDRWT